MQTLVQLNLIEQSILYHGSKCDKATQKKITACTLD
jgi:hypothetical protein